MIHYHHNTKENDNDDNNNDHYRHCRPDHHYNLHVALAGARGRGDQLDQWRGRGELDQRGGNQHIDLFTICLIGNTNNHRKYPMVNTENIYVDT